LDIGSKIREFREAQNISRYKLAKQAGIPQSTLSAIENEGKQPTIPTLEAICRGLGISLQEFFQDTSLTGDELFSAHLGSQILTLPKSKRKVIEDLLEAFKLDEENALEPSEVAREVLNKTVRMQEPSLDAVAQRLKQGRENKRISISQLSEETQIPQDKLTGFEEGFEVPSMTEFNAILDALDISPFDFFRPEKANAISLEIESASEEIQEKFKQAIINGESFSFTLKCEIVDVLKDGESVLPVEMREPKVDETTNTHTTGDGGVEGGEQYVSPQTDVEGSALTEVPEPRPKPQTRRKVETLAAHRSDDPMTDLPDEAWENVQELLEFHKHEVEKERNKPKK